MNDLAWIRGSRDSGPSWEAFQDSEPMVPGVRSGVQDRHPMVCPRLPLQPLGWAKSERGIGKTSGKVLWKFKNTMKP